MGDGDRGGCRRMRSGCTGSGAGLGQRGGARRPPDRAADRIKLVDVMVEGSTSTLHGARRQNGLCKSLTAGTRKMPPHNPNHDKSPRYILKFLRHILPQPARSTAALGTVVDGELNHPARDVVRVFACAANVVNPSHMSVTPAASQTRVFTGTRFIPPGPGLAGPAHQGDRHHRLAANDHPRCRSGSCPPLAWGSGPAVSNTFSDDQQSRSAGKRQHLP